jgi:hypothetical protein
VTTSIVFAAEGLSWPIQLLSIVGGAVLGAVGAGLLMALLARWAGVQKAPTWSVMGVRGAGGVVGALLVAMWVWNGGGWGAFGTGGPNGGDTSGNPSADKGGGDKDKDKGTAPGPVVKDADKTKPDEDKSSPAPAPSNEVALRVQVLTDDAARKAAGSDAVADGRFYHLEGKEAKDLHTLTEMKGIIKQRLSEKPKLQRLDVVTRADSPDEKTGRVAALRKWAEEIDLKVEFPPR